MTSNIAESINSTLSEIRKCLPFSILVQFMRSINRDITTNIELLRTYEDHELQRATTIKQSELIEQARFLNSIKLPNVNIYEVQRSQNSLRMRVVKPDLGECSCQFPKEYGLPCVHAHSVNLRYGIDIQFFINQNMKVGSLKRLYSGYITVVDQDTLIPNNVSGVVVHRRRGRPRNNDRIRSASENYQRRRRICTLCATPGHDKRTCPRRINQ